MNRNTPFSLSPSKGSTSSSSYDALHPRLDPYHSIEGGSKKWRRLISDTPSVFSERDVDRLYDTYHILREAFCVFAPPHVRASDLIPTKDTIIAFEEQLKAGLWFPLDPFCMDVLHFHKLSVVQLHPNS